MIEVIQGDAMSVIETFEAGQFDGVITDPPYSSGGSTPSAKAMTTKQKYTSTKNACPYPDFEGDAKDQRSWMSWIALILGDARRKCKPGSPCVVFCNWRQLPALTDAMQWAGWIWRGTAVWDKLSSRPQIGRFRQQVEFIAWGSNGDMRLDRNAPILPGVFSYANVAVSKRTHQTQKPLVLMRDLVRIVEKNGHILDPFAGSGSTLEAAKLEGYSATGIEVSAEYAAIARERLGL